MDNEKNINRRKFIKTAGKTVTAAALVSTALNLLSTTPAYAASDREDHYDFF